MCQLPSIHARIISFSLTLSPTSKMFTACKSPHQSLNSQHGSTHLHHSWSQHGVLSQASLVPSLPNKGTWGDDRSINLTLDGCINGAWPPLSFDHELCLNRSCWCRQQTRCYAINSFYHLTSMSILKGTIILTPLLLLANWVNKTAPSVNFLSNS